MVPPAARGAGGGRLSSWQHGGDGSHQRVKAQGGTEDSQPSLTWVEVGATCVPALAWLLRPGLAPVGFSSLQAAETGFNCQVASGHHFSVCKDSLVTLTHGISNGQEDVPEEQISRTVCTRVKGAAVLSHYKICVLFKIKRLYGL